MFTRLPFFIVAWLLPAAAAVAQTNTGQIAGVVRDAQGGALPGATVIAEHLESGTRITRVADEAGRYLLPSLRVGSYTITAELAGFRRLVRSGVVLQLGQVITLDLELDVGGPTESVIFNLLNTANFALPNRTFGNASFGRIFSAKNAREMQLGLRFAF